MRLWHWCGSGFFVVHQLDLSRLVQTNIILSLTHEPVKLSDYARRYRDTKYL